MNIFWRWGLIFGFLLGVLAALPAERTGAATYYWDTNGSTAGAGDTPSGTWNTANWSLDLAGTATVTSHTTTSGDILYFDGRARRKQRRKCLHGDRQRDAGRAAP